VGFDVFPIGAGAVFVIVGSAVCLGLHLQIKYAGRGRALRSVVVSKVVVVGAGYVGVTTAVALGERGHEVRLVDVDAQRVAMLAKGEIPFFEPGLPEAFKALLKARRVSVSGGLSDVASADFVFICVGTPSASDGAIDLSGVKAALVEVLKAAGSGRPLLVIKSSVVPGTTRDVLAPLVKSAWGEEGGLVVNPEFLREGSALEDARSPDRVVIGASSWPAAEAVERLWGSGRVFVTDETTAEMTKYAANAFLALKVGFANELANLCEVLGIDWYDVIDPMGADARIGTSFFRAGAGFGGSCFPKDVKALVAEARRRKRPSSILETLLASNEAQPLRVVELLESVLGPVKGKRVALLGLAFKPGTDDVRETRARPIWRELVRRGAHVVCHDPKAGPAFVGLEPKAKVVVRVEEALADAQAVVVQTEWPEYQEIDWSPFNAQKLVVVDSRRALDRVKVEAAGLRFLSLGRGASATGR
jgi:UDPglucose 6-dehydrogenase